MTAGEVVVGHQPGLMAALVLLILIALCTEPPRRG